jgi:lambda family phage tail tape measure protein
MSQVTELLVRIKEQGGEQLTRLQGSLKNLAQQTAATNINFKEASAELRRIQQTSTQSINNLKGYSSAWREIANSVDIASAEFRQATAEADRLDRQLAELQNRQRGGIAPVGRGRGLIKGAQIAGTVASAGVFGGFEGAAGALVGGVVGGVPGSIVGAGIGAGVGQTRQVLGQTATFAAELSKQRQALELVTKNASEYQRALNFIDRTSRSLAIPQDILTRQFTQLTASVKGAGGNVRDAEKAFIGVASGIRGTGGSLEQLDSALTATSQVFSKGKVSAEELRQQIGERLPGAFSLFAESLGMTPQELDKALEKGQVSLQDFQLFAEKLFERYGKSAQIIANGPDAAGDRLKTSLARLSESVGTLLKPIGAAFQNIFAGIIKVIDEAIRKLNAFLGLGKNRKEQIADLSKQVSVLDKQLTGYERLGLQRPLTGFERRFVKNLEERRVSLIAQKGALEAAQKAIETSQGEPPSRLPGITEDQKAKEAKVPVLRLTDLVSKSERNAALADSSLRIQELILIAKKKGFEYDEQILPIIGQILSANQKIRFEEEQAKDLKENRQQLLKNGMTIEEYLTRLATSNLEIETARINRKTLFVRLQQADLEFTKAQTEERAQLEKIILQTEQNARLLTERDRERANINRQIAEFIERAAKTLTSEELATAVKRLRDALMETLKATEGFGNQLAKSFADTIKSADNLAANLGASLGNAFIGLSDQFAEFVSTGKASFADFTRSVLQDLSKILIRFATFQLLKTFVPTGSALGKFLGFADGGVMTANGPMLLKRYAAGGIANSPQLAMFGEGSQPEAYVPLPDGRTIPVTMKNGGSTNVVVNVDAKGSSVQGDQGQSAALGRAVAGAVQAELIRQKRPGGLLA